MANAILVKVQAEADRARYPAADNGDMDAEDGSGEDGVRGPSPRRRQVNNLNLAALMGISPGECSRRVAQLEGVIRKARKCREVLISLH